MVRFLRHQPFSDDRGWEAARGTVGAARATHVQALAAWLVAACLFAAGGSRAAVLPVGASACTLEN
jgi:hypothetical protein